jgi:hypothetical protein
MAWANSKIFSAFITDLMNNTTPMDLNTDALLEVALYNNTTAPDQTVTSANSAYAVGQWVTGNGVTDTGTSAPAGWPALGRPLASVTSVFSTNVYTFDAADTVSANAVTTLTNAYGCLVYDHSAGTVTDQGICFNYFGGANTVTLGTFTIVWNASGIMAITL